MSHMIKDLVKPFRPLKSYYVCRAYIYGTKRLQFQAEEEVDNLSAEAINPIVTIEAHNKTEAIEEFKERYGRSLSHKHIYKG